MAMLPTRAPKVPKPVPTTLYRATTSFSTIENNRPFVVTQGTRLSADNPVVRRLPQLFVEDGLDDPTVTRIVAERRRPEPVVEPSRPKARVIPVARRMIVTEDFYWHGDRYIAGQAFDVDDEVVKAAPDFFTPAIPKE